jgi:glycosyltransferase involved in cell wall biosynthesis
VNVVSKPADSRALLKDLSDFFERETSTPNHGLPTLPNIAVIIPCHNEATTIADVIAGFRAALPRASIHVYDNVSTDTTSEVAQAAGAIVGHEPNPGKGNVVRRMFSDVDADIYIMVDGDGTYDASDCPRMIEMMLEQGLDMVCGARREDGAAAYKTGHRFGNWLFTTMVAKLFGRQFTDIFTGYRIFSRRFVKSFPALSEGFEIETELTVHSLGLRMKTAELSSKYIERPVGSTSKLHTIRDGFRILLTVLRLIRIEKPMAFYGVLSFCLLMIGSLIGLPVILEFLQTGLVPKLPRAVLASAVMMLAFLAMTAGLILEAVLVGRREMKQFHYLALEKPKSAWARNVAACFGKH